MSKEKYYNNNRGRGNSKDKSKKKEVLPRLKGGRRRNPKDTLNLISNVSNFHLQWNKLTRFDANGSYKVISDEYKDKKIEIGDNFYLQLVERQEKTAEISTTKVKCWNQTTSSRMIVGMGGASVYENSLTLHHIYGFPYIPASGIKGVVRSYLIRCFFELTENEKEKYPLEGEEKVVKNNIQKRDELLEQKAMEDLVFAAIFGTNDKAGSGSTRGNVIFFDSYPTKAPEVEVDVMTPHYGEWYGAKEGNLYSKPPADIYNPVPLTFLTVKAGTEFKFILGEQKNNTTLSDEVKNNSPLIKNSNKKLTSDFSLTKIAAYWLQRALSEHGIGAKTAVGYGFFEEAQ